MKLKKYTVIWSKKGLNYFDLTQKENDIIHMDEEKTDIWVDMSRSKIGRPVKRLATAYPVFDTEKEAVAYQGGNEDWEIVSCEIKLL